jgi:hypothetical protein
MQELATANYLLHQNLVFVVNILCVPCRDHSEFFLFLDF